MKRSASSISRAQRTSRTSRTLILATLLLLAAPLQLSARSLFQSYASRGGQTFLVSLTGAWGSGMASYPSSQYDVLVSGTSTPATIYSNLAGTPKICPCTTDSTARFVFYGDSATYDVRFSPSGVLPWTIPIFPGGGSGSVTVLAPPPSGGDDTATLQALINTNNPLGIEVVLQPGVYLLTAPLAPAPGSYPLLLGGAGQFLNGSYGSWLRASVPTAELLNITSGYGLIRNINLDAARKATYGVLLSGSVDTQFDRVAVTNALLDGFHSAAGGTNNQSVNVTHSFSQGNGKLYCTSAIHGQYAGGSVLQAAVAGTAATTAGNVTITFTGAPDLTTLGIRTGDILRVGSTATTAYWGQIQAVASSTTLTMYPLSDNLPTATAAGLDYAIGIGWGWYEESNSANGFCYLLQSWFRSNGAGGIFMGALYGDHVRDSYTDFSFGVGITMGYAYSIGTLYQPISDGVYMEGNVGPDYLFGNVTDGVITAPGGGSPIFSVGGSNTTVTINRRGRIEYQPFGIPQNFIVNFNMNGAQPRHAFQSDYWNSAGAAWVERVTGAAAAYTNTPSVSNVVDFVGGAGISAADPTILVLNSAGSQGQDMIRPTIEFDSTGLNLRVSSLLFTSNINGVTKARPALRLTDNAGTLYNWTSIGAGKTVVIGISGIIK